MVGRSVRGFCRRCGAEIVTADLMDADPGIDRDHFSLVVEGGRRRSLLPEEWRLFTALYQRHGRIVPLEELARASRNRYETLPLLIERLRRRLARSRFLVLRYPAYGYELVVRAEE
jgi:DNA-binding response OmpR family regulator